MKIFKKALAVVMCIVMTLTAAPLGGLVGLELPSLFDFKAEAATISSYSQGDIIEFGWYPQSEVTDAALVSALNSAGGEWTSCGYYSGTGSIGDGKMTPGDYMRYKDVVYGLDKYRGVVFDSYRPDCTGYTCSASYSYQDDNGYTPGTVYWFKYEPIEWRVLDPNKGMVMSETIIDAQPYNNYILKNGTDEYGYTAYWGSSAKTHYANNYAESSIRQWLNKDFYNTAFSTAQQNIIKYTQLDNSAYSDPYSAYGSQTTNDKIYLLSRDDALNADYGFSSSYSTNDTERRAQGSDYAKCQGLWVSTSSSYSGNSYWCLRTPGDYSYYACYVNYYGDVSRYSVDDGSGIRPALNFNLSSGIFQSDVIDTCEHISGDWQTKTDPTCTGEGVSVKKCTVCQAELETQPIDATGHTPGEWETKTEPTCTGEGISVKKCTVCKAELETQPIDATGHTPGEWETKIEPGCVSEGTKVKKCTVCKEEVEIDTIPVTGHDYKAVVTEPTCTEGGYTTNTCSKCSNFYRSDETEATGHKPGEWETKVEPGCENEGTKVKKCTVCKEEVETYTIPATGHDYKAVVTKPTCTVDGYTTHTCSVCDDTYTDSVVKAEGHKYDSVVTPNTCTKDGYTTHTCSVCGDTYTDSETKATGHSHESKVTKEPTCTNTGIRTFTCHCGDSYTEVIKANGHTKGEWEYIGGKEYAKSCTVCGDKLESKIVTVDMFFNSENVNKKQVLNKSTATVTATVTDNFVNDLVFASSDNSTVSVDANGNVVANNIGKATITVTIKGTAISDSIEVEVLPRDFTVTWNVNGKQTNQTVKEEAEFTPNVNTTLKGYKFIGWDKTVPTIMPAENLTFTAQYELIVKQLKVKNPSTSTINFGETLIMHADFGGVELPEGWKIQWTVEGAGFDMAPAADGLTCKMTSVANGNVTVKATLVDENGEVVKDANGNEMTDSKQLTSKAGFWQKFVSFFKNLFGISRIILQSI